MTTKLIFNKFKNSLLVLLKTPTVKVKINFITKKGTKGLDKIKKLKSTTGWIEFIKQISLYLLINRYKDLLKRNAKRLK